MKALLLEEVKYALNTQLLTPLGRGVIKGVSTDTRTIKEGELFVAVSGPRFDGHLFLDQAVDKKAAALIIDKKIPLSEKVRHSGLTVFQVPDSIEALGSLASFYRKKMIGSVHIVAVTGTNGKTTTREMIYHVLSQFKKGYRSPANYNNAIGVPLTLFGIDTNHDFAVVELGTNAPGEIQPLAVMTSPDIAVITHVGASHLQGLLTVDGVSREKTAIVAGLRSGGLLICSNNHPPTLERLRTFNFPLITYGVDGNSDIFASHIRRDGDGCSFETNDHCRVRLPVPGVHNVRNALAALLVVRRFGISTQQFAEAIADFRPVAGRMVTHQLDGLTLIDDSYNANPESVHAALSELSGRTEARRRVLVLGDMGEMGKDALDYHRQLGRQIGRSNIDILLTVGPNAAETARVAMESGMGQSRVQRAITSKRLARLVKPLLLNGDLVLVKGSRSMEMEKVVESILRWQGKKR